MCYLYNMQMIVEEMNILTTVFLRYDNEKIYYPNAVLLSKPISNFYRSPEMWDSIDFTIDASTPMETIIALKKSIQMSVLFIPCTFLFLYFWANKRYCREREEVEHDYAKIKKVRKHLFVLLIFVTCVVMCLGTLRASQSIGIQSTVW